jgi:hypothetical protein
LAGRARWYDYPAVSGLPAVRHRHAFPGCRDRRANLLKEWATRPNPDPTESGPHRERINALAFVCGLEAGRIRPGMKLNKRGPDCKPNSRELVALEMYLR